MRAARRAATALVVAGVVGAGCLFSPEPYPGDYVGTGTGGSGGGACTPAATEACYSGPAATEGVGICVAGNRTCGADAQWGACVGEVLPGTEDCATEQDEDCDGHGWGADAAGCECQPGTTRPCYGGPPGTEATGACHAGQQPCNNDGLGWSDACEDEVTPAPEICGNAVVDESCDGVVCGGDVLWAISAGGAGTQTLRDLAVDSGGNTIVVGSFSGTMIIGGMTLTAEGEDAFVIKLDPDGDLLWARRLGGAGRSAASGVAVAGDGRVFVSGDFAGSVVIGQTTLTSDDAEDEDLFVAALDADGTASWAADFGNVVDQFGGGIATRSQGDMILITGRFHGRLNLGGDNLNGSGNGDIYVARLNPDGAHVWSRKYGDGATQFGTAVALGDQVYVTGAFDGTISSGGSNYDAFSTSNVLLTKRSMGTGDHIWFQNFGDSGVPPDTHDQIGADIALDSTNNVLLTGEFGGTINFSGALDWMDSNGSVSCFVAKRGADGGHLWSKAFSSGNVARGRGIAADTAGNVLVTGEFDGSADFGDGLLTSILHDAFVVKLAPDGNHLWSRRFGGPDDQLGVAVAATAAGHVLLAGNFKGSIDLLPVPMIANNNGQDQTLFVAKLAP